MAKKSNPTDPSVMRELKYAAYRNDLIQTIADMVIDTKDEGAYAIFFYGRMAKIRKSGKAVWKLKNHATSALTTAVKYPFCSVLRSLNPSLSSQQTSEIYRELMKDLKDKGILEIRRLDHEQEEAPKGSVGNPQDSSTQEGTA